MSKLRYIKNTTASSSCTGLLIGASVGFGFSSYDFNNRSSNETDLRIFATMFFAGLGGVCGVVFGLVYGALYCSDVNKTKMALK